MRVPLSWLVEYVDIACEPEALAERLTSVGLKVEAIHRPGAEIGSVEVGEVLRIDPHPRSEKLSLVEVRTEGGPRRVVCGAHNFGVGDKVPVALAGALLPGGLKVERATIRGEVSDGMLCSARELGVSEDHAGILILATGAPVGADVASVLGLDEVILELDITPNRPDAMSLLGIAREVAAMDGSELRMPEPHLEEGAGPATGLAEIMVEDEVRCPRYLARIIEGVIPGASPDWVRRRLSAAGVRPISNLVDATNYALFVTGHPMHAFDLDRLAGPRIVVRRARAGENLRTIDGVDRRLDPDDLVIADASRAVALAGIMGGEETEVSETTRRVLLESAYFAPTTVLRSSKRHGLRSEASARFERGADPNHVAYAAELACRLVLDWAGGEVAAGAIDRYPAPVEPRVISFRPQRVNLLLGTDLEEQEMAVALTRLGLEVGVGSHPTDPGERAFRVTVPTRRPDLSAEVDLIEEVARTTGYDRIPSRLPPGSARAGGLTREQRLVRKVRQVLAGAGLFEACASSLIGPTDLDRMGYSQEHSARRPLRLTNPLSMDESLLRTTLLPGLAAAIARNVARRNVTVRLFEIGRCFLPSGELLPQEPPQLGVALHGPVPKEWYVKEREMDFFDLKGALEALFEALRIGDVTYHAAGAEPFRPGRTAELRAGEHRLGIMGELAPDASERYGFTHRAALAELELDRLLALARPPSTVHELARFPAVLLDLAVSLPEEVTAAEVVETIRSAGGAALETVRIFDLYRGEQVGPGRKSLALFLSFQRPDRTLTQEEAVAARDAIAAALKQRHRGQIRQ